MMLDNSLDHIIESNHLKPNLDTLISLVTQLATGVNKSVQNVEINEIISEAAKPVGEKVEETNNVEQNKSLQDSIISREYEEAEDISEKKKEQTLPKFITRLKKGICFCTICLATMDIYTMEIHIKGRKHKRKLNFVTTEALERLTKVLILLNNNGKTSVTQSASSSEDKFMQCHIELPDCITVRSNGTYICTICNSAISNTPNDIQLHISGRIHQKKVLGLEQSTNQDLQPQSTMDEVIGQNIIPQRSTELKDSTHKELEMNALKILSLSFVRLLNYRKLEESFVNFENTSANVQKNTLWQQSTESRKPSVEKLEVKDVRNSVTKPVKLSEDCKMKEIKSDFRGTDNIQESKQSAPESRIPSNVGQTIIPQRSTKLGDSAHQNIQINALKILSLSFMRLLNYRKLEESFVIFKTTSANGRNNDLRRPVKLSEDCKTKDNETDFHETDIQESKRSAPESRILSNIDQKILSHSSTESQDSMYQDIGMNALKILSLSFDSLLNYRKLEESFVDIKNTNAKGQNNYPLRQSAEFREPTVQKLKLQCKLLPQPMAPLKDCEVEKNISGFGKENDIGQNNVPHSSGYISEYTDRAVVKSDEISLSELIKVLSNYTDNNVGTNNIPSTENPSDHISNVENKPFCKICNKFLPDNNSSILEHMKSEKHRKQIPAPINVAKNDTYKCTLCDKIIPNDECSIKQHNGSKKHKSNILLKKISTDNAQFLNTDNSGHIRTAGNKHFCEICNKILPDNSSILEHIKSEKHRKKIPAPIIIAKTETYKRTTCDKTIPNNEISIKQHDGSKKHMRNIVLMKVSTENAQFLNIDNSGHIRTAGNKPFCKICNKFLPDNNSSILEHMKSEKHRKKIPAPINVAKNDTYKCTLCDKIIPNDECSIKQHNGSKKHKSNILLKKISTDNAQFLNTDNSGHIRTAGNKHFCEICNKILPDNSSILEHIKSEKHRKKIPAPIIIAKTKTYKCTTCDKTIPNNEMSKKQHDGSKKPMRNIVLMKVSTENAQFLNIDKSGHIRTAGNKHFCEICNEFLPENSLIIEHIKTAQHVEKIPTPITIAKNWTYECTACVMTILNDERIIKFHNESKQHKKNVSVLKLSSENEHYLSTSNSLGHMSTIGSHHFCKICNKFLPEMSSIIEHVASKKHQKKCSALMSENIENPQNDVVEADVVVPYLAGEMFDRTDILSQFIFVDGIWACKTCRIAISKVGPIDVHINSEGHQKNIRKVAAQQLFDFKNVENLWVCKICNKLLHKANKIIHMGTKNHQLPSRKRMKK